MVNIGQEGKCKVAPEGVQETMSNDNEESPASHASPFENIRKTTADGGEYWSARDLAKILGYTEYGKFKNAIQKAEMACDNSGQLASDHFAHVSDMIQVGKGAKRKIEDVHLYTTIKLAFFCEVA